MLSSLLNGIAREDSREVLGAIVVVMRQQIKSLVRECIEDEEWQIVCELKEMFESCLDMIREAEEAALR